MIARALPVAWMFMVTALVTVPACEEQPQPRQLAEAELGGIVLAPADDDEALVLSDAPAQSIRPLSAPVAALSEITAPPVAESRSYALTVTGTRLAAGVQLPTTASGAVVEIRRAPDGHAASTPLSPASVNLRTPDGQLLAGGMGMARSASGPELAAVHPGLGGDALAFELDPVLSEGEFVLSIPDAPVQSIYGIRVLEKASDVVLRVQTDRDVYHFGDTLEVSASLTRSGTPLPTDTITASLSDPEGGVVRLALHEDGVGRWVARHELRSVISHPGALWAVTLSVGVDEDARVRARRVAKTSFAYVIPTARLTGPLQLQTRADGTIVAELAVDVAAEGRYGLSGVVWGADDEGSPVAVSLSQAAAYLTPGQSTLPLPIDPSLLADVSPPFVVGNLQLVDQTRLGVLHRQDHAFELPPDLLE